MAEEPDTPSSFIVTLEDLTQQQTQQAQREQRLWALVEGLRVPAANIRAAIETVMDYAAMPIEQQRQLQQVVYEEAGRLSETMGELTAVYNSHPPANLQLDPMLGRDLLWALERRLRPLGAVVAAPPADLWLLVDSYPLLHACLFLAEKLAATWQLLQLELRLQPLRQRAALDLVWLAEGAVEPVWGWLEETIAVLGQTARQVAAHHHGELWVQQAGETAFVRLLLPVTTWDATPLPLLGSRPEYYDFGVVVAGRHTALGDALIPGDLFLKMVPLLAERGVVTLGESLTAVQQTHLARLRY